MSSGSVTVISCWQWRLHTPVWLNMKLAVTQIRVGRTFFCFSSFCIFLSNPRKNSSCFVCLQRWKNLWDVLILTESSGRFKEKHPRLLLSLLHNWTSGTCSHGDDWISGGGNTGRKSFHVINTKIGPTFAFSRLFSSLFLDKTKQKKLTRFLFIYFHTVFQQKQHNLLHPLFY